MEKLIDKLSLYDFFGYFIPGLLGTWAINVFFTDVLCIDFFVKLEEGFLNSIIFIAMSYYIGVILHETSECFQKYLFRPLWKGLPSEKFLQDNNTKYSAEIKALIKNMIKEKFGIEVDNSPIKNQEVFNLVYSSLQKGGKDEKVQLFNALYGMYRNFFAGTILCIIVFFIKSLLLWKNQVNTINSLSYTVLFVLCGLILLRRNKRFSERFVDDQVQIRV